MAAPLVFDTLRVHVGVLVDFNWTTAFVQALLVDSGGGALWTPDPTDDVVATILGAGAVETSGTRQYIATPTAALNGGTHRVYWDSDPIVYPGVGVGEQFDRLVLYNLMADDTDSWLIATYDLGAQVGDGDDVTINPASLGFISL